MLWQEVIGLLDSVSLLSACRFVEFDTFIILPCVSVLVFAHFYCKIYF